MVYLIETVRQEALLTANATAPDREAMMWRVRIGRVPAADLDDGRTGRGP
jgi:hypothetical protein